MVWLKAGSEIILEVRVRSSRIPGSGFRWKRRYGRTLVSPPLTTPILVRGARFTRGVLWQITVGVAIVFAVIGIALWDSSIRRFLEATIIIAPGVGLAFGGYPQVGVPLATVGVAVPSWFIYCWCRKDMLQTSYPVSRMMAETSAKEIREPI